MKKLAALLSIIVILVSACNKSTQTACGTQACTDLFASVGVQYRDSNNNPIAVTNFKVLDLRTNKTLTNELSASANLIGGAEIIVDDSNLKDLTNDGDNIQVSATVQSSGKTLSTSFNIAGGCNCHVRKLAGPDVIIVN